MSIFYFHVSDGRQNDLELEASDAHDAINTGLNALSQFAFRHFPPPECISIEIRDRARHHVATLDLSFKITYGEGIRL